MSTNANPPGPTGSNYSQIPLLIDAGIDSDVVGFWTDPTAALWAKACVAAGKSVGVPGCPSREVADAMFAIMGA